MKILGIITTVLIFGYLAGCSGNKTTTVNATVIANGQMPNIVKDDAGNLHLVYGSGDSILYRYSSDGGFSFSSPEIIDVLPKLAASHMRGPQIAASKSGLSVIASNTPGDIFSFHKEGTGNWIKTGKVNDADTVAKEGLMALGASGNNCFAVWLDLRSKHNQVYGATSADGGKTWNKNQLIYASPDTTVCECCKPSVLVNHEHVYVMFRNWLHGSRDLYLLHSADTGKTFGNAQKLGNGTWQLDGCPMDGGGLAMDNKDEIFTVWRREGKIYSCEAGQPEVAIGEGRNCTIEIVNIDKIYAWTENGDIKCLLPGEHTITLGKGQQPLIKAINDKQLICIWEHDKQIHRSIFQIL